MSKESKPQSDLYDNLTQFDKDQVDRAVTKGHSRRDVLKLMAITGLGLASVENLMSASQKAMAQTPRKGGSVRMASSLAFSSL